MNNKQRFQAGTTDLTINSSKNVTSDTPPEATILDCDRLPFIVMQSPWDVGMSHRGFEDIQRTASERRADMSKADRLAEDKKSKMS